MVAIARIVEQVSLVSGTLIRRLQVLITLRTEDFGRVVPAN